MQKYIIPKKGIIVRDPFSKTPLPEKGGLVDWNGNAGRYWRRRVKDESVSIIEESIKEEIEEESNKSTFVRTTSKKGK